MATSPSEFIELAAELFEEFAEFAKSTAISKKTATSFSNPTGTLVTTTIPTITIDFESSQIDGKMIMVGDYMLIGQYQKLSYEPTPDICITVREGVTAEVKNVKVDPAKASIIMHVRVK